MSVRSSARRPAVANGLGAVFKIRPNSGMAVQKIKSVKKKKTDKNLLEAEMERVYTENKVLKKKLKELEQMIKFY